MRVGRLKTWIVALAVLGTVAGVASPATAEPSKRDAPLVAIRSLPKPTATPVELIDTLQAANDTLTKLGITPFLWPTFAPFCSDVGAPLGIVPAVAGAVTGPYTPLVGSIPPILGNDLNTVKSGEVLYGFVPAGIVNDSADKAGMNVAWFNVNSFKGGFVPMGSLSDAVLKPIDEQIAALGLLNNPITKLLVDNALKPLKSALNDLPQAGVRAATVKTGQGLVLSAILGTVKNGANTCFFLPTVGIQQVG
ncbi:hypothetical protein [Gordonia sp. CPCC 205333]|uniref:hypothetical protein n=1 Tax=Gordonia sp. CPCC 205333 TaxID=3140790 RepID=UPI003AF36EB3